MIEKRNTLIHVKTIFLRVMLELLYDADAVDI